MDRFFEQQRADGALDSSGGFTISPDLARQKLQDFQLASPEFYLLKVVQAAVAGGASSLQVKVGRASMEVRFDPSDRDLKDPHRLAAAMLEVYSLPNSALRHLAVGVNAACSAGLEELCWETPQGQLVVNRDELRCENKEFSHYCLRFSKKWSVLDWLKGTLFAVEVKLLTQRCQYAPLEVVVDKRPMERPDLDRYGHYAEDDLGLSDRHYLLERQKPGGSQVWFRQPPVGVYDFTGDHSLWMESRYGTPVPLLLQGATVEETVSVEIAVALQMLWCEPGTLLLVKDGVTLDPIVTDELGHPGVVVVTGADDLPLDLSEFGVVQGEAYLDKLAQARRFVRDTVQGLSEDDLQLALGPLELSEDQLELALTRLYKWLQNNGLGEPTTVEELALQCFPNRAPVYLSPDIPMDKETNVRSAHQEHLPSTEPLLVLYDDTLFGGAKTGFAITPQRLVWRDTLDSSRYLVWENLCTRELRQLESKVSLMGAEISCIMKPALVPRLTQFLETLSTWDHPSTQTWSEQEATVVSAALQHLGKRSHIHYHPHIPTKRLEAISENFRHFLEPEERPLLFYDDTLLGNGQVGCLFTHRGFYWRNTLTEAQKIEWSDSKLDSVVLEDTALEFSGRRLTCCHGVVREQLKTFIEAVVRLHRQPSAG